MNEKEVLTKENKIVVKHQLLEVDGVSVFYREAGSPQNETILMLHGFPSSSHMYRKVIEGLANDFHIVAPDYPGFGFSDIPSINDFEYTFDNITKLMQSFIQKLGLDSFTLMMQDYGGPIGFRIAKQNPEKINGLIIQNANAYLDGLGEWPQKIGAFWEKNDLEGLGKFKEWLMSKEGIEQMYLKGASDTSAIDPISYLTDESFLRRVNVKEVQSELFSNYGSNFALYEEWQNYFRAYQPASLVIWGSNDPFFSKPGGEAYSRDLTNIETHFFNGGHFILEEYPEESIALIRNFLKNK
ncbi:alpha/beta fold hydrolase [Labilibacter marinus]|uniref:alpha/beta fold hydrolase n=1 Tax=Labilibacter marinus TaxID=1477105 RepID=UPI0008342F21|nr:alpha/beta hydrolase [Labilibacter marinus]